MTGQTHTSTPTLRRIRAKNLLSFGPDGIDLEMSNLNVLIGPNASGKTNLFEVIRLLQASPSDLSEPVRTGGGISLYGNWEFGRSATIRNPQRNDVRPSPLTEDLSNLGMFLNRLVRYPSAKARLTKHLADLYEGITEAGPDHRTPKTIKYC